MLASYDTASGVFDPSRHGNEGTIARTLDLCWEVEPSGDHANGALCDEAVANGTTAFDDVRSPYDGTHRDVYLRDTRLANAGGPRLWWTDPYGGNASPQPFPGAICSSSPRSTRPRARASSSASSAATAATTARGARAELIRAGSRARRR